MLLAAGRWLLVEKLLELIYLYFQNFRIFRASLITKSECNFRRNPIKKQTARDQ